ncbi:Hypothetical predicted protein, partial [Paramuricea clavata]
VLEEMMNLIRNRNCDHVPKIRSTPNNTHKLVLEYTGEFDCINLLLQKFFNGNNNSFRGTAKNLE